MKNIKYPKRKSQQLSIQQLNLRKKYPESKSFIKNGVLYWDGYLCPTAISNTYHVHVTYKMNYRPKVVLSGENIQGLDRQDFPHNFGIDKEHKSVKLCLHLPSEFNSHMLIADTIIPWTIEWLFHYELWLATGKWHGGGEHSVA